MHLFVHAHTQADAHHAELTRRTRNAKGETSYDAKPILKMGQNYEYPLHLVY